MKINPHMSAKHRASGERLASVIDRHLPPGTGFALLIFDFGDTGDLSWISNAERDDMIATMKDFIARNEGRAMPGPTTKQ